MLGGKADGKGEHRRGHTNQRHEAVVDLTVREQAEGEKTKQGAIGVGDDGVDGIDERRGVDGMDKKDGSCQQHAHGQMGPTAQPLVVRTVTQVVAVAGGKGGEGRIGTGERGRHNAEGEERREE